MPIISSVMGDIKRLENHRDDAMRLFLKTGDTRWFDIASELDELASRMRTKMLVESLSEAKIVRGGNANQ